MINGRRAEASFEPWQPHPILASIVDDDPHLEKILRSIGKPVVPMNAVIDDGPFGRTTVYVHASSYDGAAADNDSVPKGLLETWTAHGRRFSFALAYAKYLLALKRLGELERVRNRAADERLPAEHGTVSHRALAAERRHHRETKEKLAASEEHGAPFKRRSRQMRLIVLKPINLS